MNLKHIAATLAILGSASFAMTGCKKSGEGTETPADGEKKADGSCGGEKKADGSCGGEKKADGSCGGEKKPAEGEGGGEAAPPAA